MTDKPLALAKEAEPPSEVSVDWQLVDKVMMEKTDNVAQSYDVNPVTLARLHPLLTFLTPDDITSRPQTGEKALMLPRLSPLMRF